VTAPIPEPSNGRQRVLDAAAERFVVQGYAATTLRQIAGDVGIKAGSIYHHFPSKEALFEAVLAHGIDVMVDAFERVETDAPAATRDRLAAHVRAHLGALFEHGSYTAAHVTAFFTAPPEVRGELVQRRDAYEHRWNGLLADVFPQVEDRRRHLQRLLLFGALNSTIEWFDPNGDISLDELAELTTDQFLVGVAGVTA
jgi:TetR/AcrR family transcriptional regulator, cholesterol catabolism regulator